MDVRHGCLLLGWLLLFCTSGCSPAEPAGTSAESSPEKKATPNSAAETPRIESAQLIVGTWYGRARLNKGLLQRKLDSITSPADRKHLAQMAQTFQSTEIGVVFGADGSMELDIQIQPAGQAVLRDNTRGSWRPVEVLPDAIVMETTEPSPEGGNQTQRVRYQFEMDGQIAIMSAPTSGHLADCNPVFVFERVGEPTATVADRAGNRLIH